MTLSGKLVALKVKKRCRYMSKTVELAIFEALGSVRKICNYDASYFGNSPNSVVGGGDQWHLPQLTPRSQSVIFVVGACCG